MIPCFVISLPDCTDRRESIAIYLRNVGIEFEFVDAVDGRNGLDNASENQIDRIAAREAGLLISDVEFACALSHASIYRKIVAEQISFALVLEDDAVPLPSLYEFLNGGYYLGADLVQIYSENRRIRVQRKNQIKLFDNHVSYLRARQLPCPGAVGYIISQRGALHFIQAATPINNCADWPDCVEDLVAEQKCRLIYPSLVLHKDNGRDSLLGQYGRISNKEQRRVFGVYLPPFRRIYKSILRAPTKLYNQRLPHKKASASQPFGHNPIE